MTTIFIGASLHIPHNQETFLWDNLNDKSAIPGFNADYFHKITPDADLPSKYFGVNLAHDNKIVNTTIIDSNIPIETRYKTIQLNQVSKQIEALKNLESIQPYLEALKENSIEYSFEFLVSEMRF